MPLPTPIRHFEIRFLSTFYLTTRYCYFFFFTLKYQISDQYLREYSILYNYMVVNPGKYMKFS